MTTWKQARGSVVAVATKPPVTLALLLAGAAIPLLTIALFLPRPIVLPAVSLMSTAAAALAAVFAWWAVSEHDRDRITLWDLAGACALIGFAAGMLSRPELVVEYLTSQSSQRIWSP